MLSIIYYLLLLSIIFILFISFSIIRLLLLTVFLLAIFALPYIFRLFNLRKYNTKLDNITNNPQINNMNKEYKRKLAYIILNINNRKENSTKHIKNTLLYTGLGYTIADIGLNKAIRYGIGYYMLRKLIYKKINKTIE